MEKITPESRDLRVRGHRGKWDVIDVGIWCGVSIFCLEHNTLGEDTACKLVDEYGRLLFDEAHDGLANLNDFQDWEELRKWAMEHHAYLKDPIGQIFKNAYAFPIGTRVVMDGEIYEILNISIEFISKTEYEIRYHFDEFLEGILETDFEAVLD